MPRLYHISETPGITCFEPRPVPNQPDRSVVWAIDKPHLPNYLLPRDCPRVTFYCGKETTDDDRERFFNGVYSTHVIAIETGWYDRAVNTPLIRYAFPLHPFTLADPEAGYWLSDTAVKPLSEQVISQPVAALLSLGIELRVMPSLWALREAVIHSSLCFSIIRMRHAISPEGNSNTYTPVPSR